MAARAIAAFVGCACLLSAIGLIDDWHGPDWMVPLMKWWFALAYVVLAAFVGAFADSFPKGRVMFSTNSVKIAGCILMFLVTLLADSAGGQLTWIFVAYTLVGVGAAAYSPAKYGIITEMLKPELLVKGNSWIEGLTVLSIIVGTVLGGVLIHPDVSHFLMRDLGLSSMAYNRAEAAILVIA